MWIGLTSNYFISNVFKNVNHSLEWIIPPILVQSLGQAPEDPRLYITLLYHAPKVAFLGYFQSSPGCRFPNSMKEYHVRASVLGIRRIKDKIEFFNDCASVPKSSLKYVTSRGKTIKSSFCAMELRTFSQKRYVYRKNVQPVLQHEVSSVQAFIDFSPPDAQVPLAYAFNATDSSYLGRWLFTGGSVGFRRWRGSTQIVPICHGS